VRFRRTPLSLGWKSTLSRGRDVRQGPTQIVATFGTWSLITATVRMLADVTYRRAIRRESVYRKGQVNASGRLLGRRHADLLYLRTAADQLMSIVNALRRIRVPETRARHAMVEESPDLAVARRRRSTLAV